MSARTTATMPRRRPARPRDRRRRRSGRRGRGRRGPAAAAPRRRRSARGPGAGVVGSSSASASSSSGPRRVAPSPSARRRRRRRVAVVRVTRLGGRSRVGSGPRRAPRFAPAQLLQEVVEQVAHVARSLRVGIGQGRWRPSTARTNAASTVSASSFGRIAAARAGSNRNAARTASARATAGRVVGRGDSPRRIWSRPRPRGSGRTARRDRRAETGERRIGRRPGGRRDVAEADDPLVVGDPQIASHQPSGASDGRAMPARSVRSPMRTACSRRNDGPGGGRRSGTRAG